MGSRRARCATSSSPTQLSPPTSRACCSGYCTSAFAGPAGRQPGRGWPYPPLACFNAEVSAFDYRAPAELYASASKTGKRPMRYTRLKSAADAIKYAVEVLPPELLIGSTLEVNEERFDGFGIRA